MDYELTERSRHLVPALAALARWGYDWAWTAPRDGEAIDIGAILRVAPGLCFPPAGLAGVTELTVEQPDGVVRHYALTAARGALSVAEVQAPDADARISGTENDWIEALGPDAARTGLRIEGDRHLAAAMLDGIVAAADRRAQAA